MPAASVDAARIIAVLNQHQVKYVVVGGFAVELWGVAVQPTIDVDITPEMSRLNLGRLAEALGVLGARIRSGDETIPVPGGFTPELLEQMRVLNLATDSGPLDLTMVPAGTGGYVELSPGATSFAYRDVDVPTAALEDVARSKEAAGRPKDLKTLPAIYEHIRRINRG